MVTGSAFCWNSPVADCGFDRRCPLQGVIHICSRIGSNPTDPFCSHFSYDKWEVAAGLINNLHITYVSGAWISDSPGAVFYSLIQGSLVLVGRSSSAITISWNSRMCLAFSECLGKFIPETEETDRYCHGILTAFVQWTPLPMGPSLLAYH